MRNPHFATKCLHRDTLDIRANYVCLAHVVGKPIVVPIIGCGIRTLVRPGLCHGPIVPSQLARRHRSGDNRPMSEELQKVQDKINKEFKKVSESVADIHVAFHAVKDAGPMDDLYGLLDDLEDRVKKARTGGLTGSGAKGHRKALAEYRDLLGPVADS